MKLLNLSNWLTGLVESFTFYGGGGGGGQQTSKTSSELDPTVRPFVEYGLQEAKGLYKTPGPSYFPGQTYISPSAQTQASLQAAEQRALAGSPLTQAAQQQQLGTIGGQYLSAGNPYLTQALAGPTQQATQAYNDAIKAAQGTASMAGRYGSGVSADIQNRAAQTLSNTLANKYGELAYGNYQTERARQEAASGLAPQMAAADYADIQQLANVGKTAEGYQQTALQSAIDRYNYEQNLPYQKLASYLGAAYGAPMGQVSTSQSSGGGKIVCTAMNNEYGFGSFRNAIWLAQSKDLDPAYEKGYHKLFLPLVNYAYKAGEKNALQRILRAVLEHIARHRTADIWKQKRGKNRDNLGMVYRFILEPICYVVGKVGK
jgi:K+-transporting ATPase c subunit